MASTLDMMKLQKGRRCQRHSLMSAEWPSLWPAEVTEYVPDERLKRSVREGRKVERQKGKERRQMLQECLVTCTFAKKTPD